MKAALEEAETGINKHLVESDRHTIQEGLSKLQTLQIETKAKVKARTPFDGYLLIINLLRWRSKINN